MRTSVDFRKRQRRRADLHRHSEAAVATIWLVFYVVGIAVVLSTPIILRALEVAAR
jgi:hypothetical protein